MRFRSSPNIELKQLGDLAAEQREPFRDLESDPDFYGLFVPRPPLTINLKSVNRQAAELFQMLATPSHIHPANDELIDLVLDGILEIESDGDFASGADALPAIGLPDGVPEVRDAITRLSRDALLYAQDLETSDPQALTIALY